MKSIIKLLLAVLLLFVVALSGCERNKNIIKIKNATAVIVSKCSEYPDYKDSISIKLDEMPYEILAIYPDKPFADEFREVGLKVVVSGVIYKNVREINDCLVDSTVKIAPSNKFKIISIKKQ